MTTTIGRIDINEKDLPKICGAIIQLEEHSETFATTADVTAAIGGGGGGGAGGSPGGRLTLQTLTPVMTTTQSAKTTIYYTPYNGSTVPTYSGTAFTGTAFSELSVLTTDTTKSPAAIGASKVNDWFVWLDGSTVRLGHGPDWTSDTARSVGTALVIVNGIWLNNASITNGPAAQRGTYVGTTRSNASSQLDWIYGGLAANGTAGVLGVWNCYNRRPVATVVEDSTDSWAYNVVAWRAANNSATMRVSFVVGLQEDALTAQYTDSGISVLITSGIGVGYDSTTTQTGSIGGIPVGIVVCPTGSGVVMPGIGYHFISAVEIGSASGCTFYGDAGSAVVQNGLFVQFYM